MKYLIKELGHVLTGNTPSKKESLFYDSNDIGFVKPDIISDSEVTEIASTSEYISENAREKSRIVPTDSVLVTCIGSIGKIGIVRNQECAFNQQINAIQPNEKVLPEYLAYCLLHNKMRLTEIANASVVPIINKTQFENFEIQIADRIETQRQQLKVLNRISTIIRLRQRQISELDTLIKARFVEMFGDPKKNTKGFTKAPMGNYMTVLTDFSSNGSYKTLDSGVIMYDEPNFAWMVRTTDLETRDMRAIKYIDEKAYELLAKSKIYGGEIIMNKIGSAGKIYLMPEISMPASLGRNAFMFRYDERINTTYLYIHLISEYGQNEIGQYVRGAVTKTITKADARAVEILVPPIELQNEFVSFVTQIDKLKLTIQKSIKELEALKDSLMQQYFC